MGFVHRPHRLAPRLRREHRPRVADRRLRLLGAPRGGTPQAMGQPAITRSRRPVIRGGLLERQAGVWRPGVPGGAPGRALAHARLARQDGESPVRHHDPTGRAAPRGRRPQGEVAQARAARRRGGRAGPVGSDTARSLRAAGTQPGSRSQTVTASGRWGSYCRRTVVWSNPSGTSYRAPCQRT